MKLNIEELAREVGAVSNVLSMGRHDGTLFSTGELETFTRLIVERCAEICDKEQREWSEFSDGHVAFRETASAIRNLLEAE